MTPGLLVRITRATTLKNDSLALVGRWRDSGRLPDVAAATAGQLLSEGSGGA